jgi:hypothetical protein
MALYFKGPIMLMNKALQFVFAFLSMATLVSIASVAAAADVPANCYLFSYFLGNGEDGLHLAWSADGLRWEALKDGKSFLTPMVGKSKLMRDPCVTTGPDGTFHMVWTDSWDSTTIGYASSRDLITWSAQQAVPVMNDEPTTRNCWAPEIIYDAPAKRFMIFWASTIPGRFPDSELEGKNDNNHRIYATTTQDFVKFTPTKLFFDPGFNCIDAMILPFDGKAVMFFKNETKLPTAMKNLRIATAPTIFGPYEVAKTPITPPGSWSEGPSALKVGNQVILYFDAYTQHHYSALSSRDMREWKDVTRELSMPKGIRHGTAFEVPGAIVKELLKQ